MNKLEAIVPGAATMARLRRLNAKTTDIRRVGKRSLQERLMPRQRPLIFRVQEFRALKYWTDRNYGNFSTRGDCRFVSSDFSSQDSTLPCECCTEYGDKAC
jgi:hypothetical protein